MLIKAPMVAPLWLTPQRESSRPAHLQAQCPAQVCLEVLSEGAFMELRFHPEKSFSQLRLGSRPVSCMLRVYGYSICGSEITTGR